MKTWRHPVLGEIGPIPTKLFPKKLWRHFYDHDEQWKRICDADVGGMRAEVEGVVGISRAESVELPKVDSERWRAARSHFTRHHGEAYAPCYMAELARSETVWTDTADRQLRHCALTPKSIFAVVQLEQFLSWVVTAFRPLPPTTGVQMDEGEMRQYAEDYFMWKTGVNIENIAAGMIRGLKRCDGVPSDLVGLWWLASAVGFGRLLRSRGDVRESLEPAEVLLSQVPSELKRELAGTLDWQGLDDELAVALKEERPEDFEAWLFDTESVLAVAGALGEEEAVQGFLERAERLIPWVSVEWGHLLETARLRTEGFDSTSQVARLWSAVEEALVGEAMRSEVPSIRPAARLVDTLIPDEGVSLWERVRELGRRVRGRSHEAVEAVASAIRVAHPVPLMGDASGDVAAEVIGAGLGSLEYVRVFVLDEGHPDGCEVTESANVPNETMWQFEDQNERALVVIVAAERPLGDGDLAALVDEAERREDITIAARELQPSQATNAKR